MRSAVTCTYNSRPMSEFAQPTAVDLLRSRGLRVTSQRRVILGVFGTSDSGHLSAEQVYGQAAVELPELARATVYNTLNDFVGAGLLRRLDGFGSALYDHNVAGDHHHFHCVGCGRLFDVEPSGLDCVDIGAANFEVDRTEVLFRGTCGDCAVATS